MGVPLDQLLALMGVLAVVGLGAGFIAGMFGIGGGVVIVPALYFALGGLGVEEAVRMHCAVATSLAVIIVTSLRSVRAHHSRGAVDMGLLKGFVPWIVAGALIGALVARWVPGNLLTGLFGATAILVAARMAFFPNPRPLWNGVPTGPARAATGTGMGLLSSWMGIGGGIFGVILLTLSGRPLHQAVGTAAGFGAAIGLPGALGFIIGGLGVEGLPPLSLGYVNLAGFALIAALAAITTPFGAKVAHALSQQLLSRIFAAVLAVLGIRMLVGAFLG